MVAAPVSVFISYSTDSEPHRSRVLALARQLHQLGIQVWFDRFVTLPPDGWERWTLEQLALADFVLVVCSERYRQRYEGRVEPDPDEGTMLESLVSTCLLHRGPQDQPPVVLLFEGARPVDIPAGLEQAPRFVLPQALTGLLRHLGARGVESTDMALEARGDPTDLPPLPPDHAVADVTTPPGAQLDLAPGAAAQAPIPPAPTSLEAGLLLGAGRYELRALLGSGGLGAVWRARDRRERRPVAIKVLHRHHSRDLGQVARFFRISREMARLDLPGVVRIHTERGEEHGFRFFVMEFMAEGNLQQAVSAPHKARRVAFRMLEQAAHAVQALHTLGVPHLNLKPQNLLLSTGGTCHLSDLDPGRLIQPDLLANAPNPFLAPEMAQDPRTTDGRSDLYSLAMLVLYTLLDGHLPVSDGMDPRHLLQGLDASIDLREVLALALAPRPQQRELASADLAAAIALEAERLEARAPLVERRDPTQSGEEWVFAMSSAPLAAEVPEASIPPVSLADGLADADTVDFSPGVPADDAHDDANDGPPPEPVTVQDLPCSPAPEAPSAAYQPPVQANPPPHNRRWLPPLAGVALLAGASALLWPAVHGPRPPEAQTGTEPQSTVPETTPGSHVTAGAASSHTPPPGSEPSAEAGPATDPQRIQHVALAGRADLLFIAVPGGSFLMGSPDGQGLHDEQPQHDVTVSPLWVAATEVTQAQYVAVMGKNPAEPRGPELPVNRVSWCDAVHFTNALSKLEGLEPAYTELANCESYQVTWKRPANGYRLPTEAEWEYLARAGSDENWWFGNDPQPLADSAWYQQSSAGRMHQVALLLPNPWGLFDLHGNLGEWCWDVYRQYDPGKATYYADENPPRVLRGGTWASPAEETRSAYRTAFRAGRLHLGVAGIRPVRDLK